MPPTVRAKKQSTDKKNKCKTKFIKNTIMQTLNYGNFYFINAKDEKKKNVELTKRMFIFNVMLAIIISPCPFVLDPILATSLSLPAAIG